MSNSKKNLTENQSIHSLDEHHIFFYRWRVKTTPRKGVLKLGVKKIVSNFLCENGSGRTTKTIPVGIFADITLFHPLSGVDI